MAVAKVAQTTNYKAGQDNITPFGLDIHNPVFLVSSLAIIVFVLYTLMFQEQAAAFFGWLRPVITRTFDWFFLSAGNIFVVFALLLVFLPVGSIRLGGKNAKPDFSFISWLAMLFAAGMGIGLIFFGVSEPLSHFASSMGGTSVEHGIRTDWAPLGAALDHPQEAKKLAMAATIFHWGLHPWSIYAVVALAMAFFAYNKRLPLTLRSAFYPLLGERIWGWPGHVIDTLAVFATLFGLATSLGFGTMQILAGFHKLYDWGMGETAMVILITLVTLVAMFSVLRGLDGGIRRLSEINIIIAALFLLFVLLAGPTWEILTTFFSGGLAYLQNVVPLSMPFGREDVNFSQGWTAFYWAWWISWSPFVGMFIARVSKGRTVREFITCVVLVPTILSVIWMSVFGGTAITQVLADAAAPVGQVAQELKLFAMVDLFPFSAFLSVIGILLVLVFFVTSSDSGSLVIDMITAGGKTNVPVAQRVFWCCTEGIVAAVLLLVGGKQALGALQAMTVSSGLPFTLVLLVMCYSIWVGLNAERKQTKAT